MSLKDDFEIFTDKLKPDNISDMETTAGEIAKKLNKSYYDLDSDSDTHMYIVGSVGRRTSIKGVSDLDLLFDLPSEKYTQFNNYSGNGQSALLQEVKNVLKEKYPKTDISGDGQVVVINFTKYTVELVPGFKQSDDRFKYPDTNDGGSWKYTDPLPEKEESKNTADDTDNNFIYIANMLRAWKNKQGFKFGGLLIDTLTYNFLKSEDDYRNIGFSDYFKMTKALFNYLKGLDKNQSYWFALGSNQHVYNCDSGKFVTKAEKAYKKIKDLDEDDDDVNKELRSIFGNKFPKKQTQTDEAFASLNSRQGGYSTEEFIEDFFPVDIRYDLEIDCDIKEKGRFLTILSKLLNSNRYLRVEKQLKFYISNTDIDFSTGEYSIYWKVKNNGPIAKSRHMERGQIKLTNSQEQREHSDFIGEHFVECYVVKNEVCVARAHIDVPISNYEYIMG